jgi:hypothetical protein
MCVLLGVVVDTFPRSRLTSGTTTVAVVFVGIVMLKVSYSSLRFIDADVVELDMVEPRE